jgi:hypothetical protein
MLASIFILHRYLAVPKQQFQPLKRQFTLPSRMAPTQIPPGALVDREPVTLDAGKEYFGKMSAG